ncbi:hypothetical protein TrVE_jg167 [Triparma verrucosa]|uniref:Serine-threonine kinase receptor-associated protein n=2 Tax=Triparma TaxID=722752 RepID=A0A9W6ZHQ0_9STRA|nr:hypothetical protein TrVE_jg167 [Triparma verrucosa]GMH52866.1 hypothetical protein TrST_g3849 [Triparma strigata]
MSAPRQIPIVCPGHTRPLAELQFLPHPSTGPLLISACHDRTPMLRSGSTGDWIGSFVGHKGAVWSAKMDKEANLAATASGDFSARLWDAINGNHLATFQHKHIVKTVQFSPDSTLLATGGHEGLLRVFDLNQFKVDKAAHSIPLKAKANITKCCWGVAPALENLVTVSDSTGLISSFDIRTQKVAHTMKVDAGIMDMELCEDDRNKLVVSAGKKVSFFDMSSFQLLKSVDVAISFNEEGGTSLHPDGTKFVTGGSDLWVRVYDYNSGECLETNKGHHGPIRCVRYAPGGASYATGSEDGTIRLWRS